MSGLLEHIINNEICIGALVDQSVLHPHLAILDGVKIDKDPSVRDTEKVNARRLYDIIGGQYPYFFIRSPLGKNLAVLYLPWTRFLDLTLIRLQASFDCNDISDPIGGSLEQPLSRIRTSTVNISARPDLAHDIGRILGENLLFLQHPSIIEPHIVYINPQYFYWGDDSRSESQGNGFPYAGWMEDDREGSE